MKQSGAPSLWYTSRIFRVWWWWGEFNRWVWQLSTRGFQTSSRPSMVAVVFEEIEDNSFCSSFDLYECSIRIHHHRFFHHVHHGRTNPTELTLQKLHRASLALIYQLGRRLCMLCFLLHIQQRTSECCNLLIILGVVSLLWRLRHN